MNSGVDLAPFFSLTHVQNTGAAFGIAQDGNLFFIGTSIVILVVLGLLHRRLAAQGRWTALGLPLLWGGALGNLLDRVRLGSVTDFLRFHWRRWAWPDFNAADSAICIAVALMCLDSFRKSPESSRAAERRGDPIS